MPLQHNKKLDLKTESQKLLLFSMDKLFSSHLHSVGHPADESLHFTQSQSSRGLSLPNNDNQIMMNFYKNSNYL